MDLQKFKDALSDPDPPEGLAPAPLALWHAGRGEWARAHEIAQAAEDDADCAWVHAYLHREEGDRSNAAYWYRRAGRPFPAVGQAAEWESIAAALLSTRD